MAVALGYKNTSKALNDHVDEEDKLNNESLSSLGQRGGWIINESGLYSLILSSKLKDAKRFKRWVTSEVLPSIRKHGAYLTDSKIEEALLSPDTLINLATQIKEERRLRMLAEEDVERMKPKEIFADAVSVSENSISVGGLAKLLKQNGVNIGQNRLFEWLRFKDYLIKGGEDKNLPTQKSMNAGWFEIKERVVINPKGIPKTTKTTKVTGKGQLYFINKFLKKMKEMEEAGMRLLKEVV